MTEKSGGQTSIFSLKYIPALDGLRALAIAGVLANHLGIPGLDVGGTGVNLFFVISGFLITGILLDTKEDPYYFRNFYMRRSFRIFPIYYIALIILFLPVFKDNNVNNSDGIFYVFYLQNYLLGLKDFHVNFPGAFLHTWSLALEEQFYLVWPFIAYKLSSKNLIRLTGILFGTALLFRIYILTFMPERYNICYTGLPGQMDSLMAGAFLAVLVRTSTRPAEKIANIGKRMFALGGAGVFLLFMGLGASVYIGKHDDMMVITRILFNTFLAVWYGGLVAYTALKPSQFAQLMSLAPIRYFGKISYGVYLWHLPLFTLIEKAALLLSQQGIIIPEVVINIFKLVMLYFLADFSWRFIESPILKLKDRYFTRAVIAAQPQP